MHVCVGLREKGSVHDAVELARQALALLLLELKLGVMGIYYSLQSTVKQLEETKGSHGFALLHPEAHQ